MDRNINNDIEERFNLEAAKALEELKGLKHSEASSEGCGSCGDSGRFGVPLNWPIQLKLAPEVSEVYNNADLLIAADCACFIYPKFHRDFINGSVVFIDCAEPDGTDFTAKLSRILGKNDFRSVTVARMEVPCCGRIEDAVKNAVSASGRVIPCKTVVFSTEGDIL